MPPTMPTDDIRAAVASLGLAPLTETIFSRTGWLPIAACIGVRALVHPTADALVAVSAAGEERTWSWAELASAIDATAAWLVERGARPGTRVAVALPNGAGHIIATQAVWRVGATAIPVDPRLPAAPRSDLVERLDVVVVVEETPVDLPRTSFGGGYRLADPHSILPTGGTLGEPRLAVQSGSLWGRLDGPPPRLRDGYGLTDRQTQLVTLPLHHGFGHGYAHQYGLAYGHCLILQEHFDADAALALIDRWRVQVLATVPTALQRIGRAATFNTADLSSLEVLLHGAASCPAEVKRLWIDRLGAQRVFEAYGATEVSIDCTIRGDEWMRRPGSVGRPIGCAIEVRGEDGAMCGPGVIGEIFVRPLDRRAAHPEVVGVAMGGGREARATGDVGYVDDDGYLYVVGRVALQLVSGGVTIYVEATETTLAGHPAVSEAAVVPVHHDDLGEVPHALVRLEDVPRPDIEDLVDWCRARLAPAQVPRSVEIVADLAHTPVGKLDRVALRDAAQLRRRHT